MTEKVAFLMKDLVLFARTWQERQSLDGLPTGTLPLHVKPVNYLRLRDQL